jgi:hypothetical protein
MLRKMLRSISLTLTSILCLMVFQQAALAGPPLICHPFDIGNARSLPWSGPQWRAFDKNYYVKGLVNDTLGLLTPETPVLIRMETLRRATVYALLPTLNVAVASPVTDATVANELLSRLKARIPDPGVKSDKKTTAIALFDYGYLIESYKQAGDNSQGPKLSGGIDGYGMIVKAIALRGADPEMEFAAALASNGPLPNTDARRAARAAHIQRAAAGAQEGSLLARNLLTFYSDKGKTIGELRANVAKN